MKSIDELTKVEKSVWPRVLHRAQEPGNHLEILPPDASLRSAELLALQMPVSTILGALVYESGGILIDYGWLRILGSGHPRLQRSLSTWNLAAVGRRPGEGPMVLIADDVLGGTFALSSKGCVYYFAPDALVWEDTELDMYGFLDFCFSGNLELYYRNLRWPGWQDDIKSLTGEQGLSVYPFLGFEKTPIAERKRGTVPFRELFALLMDLSEQVALPR